MTESTLRVYSADGRVVVVEYAESLLLESTGTVNEYSVGAIVTVVAEATKSTLVERVVVTVVVRLSNVTCVVIPLTVISVTDSATSTTVLISSVSVKVEVEPS